MPSLLKGGCVAVITQALTRDSWGFLLSKFGGRKCN
nr:MAG TPA: hypothetical protein [Bacteriophage sp.]